MPLYNVPALHSNDLLYALSKPRRQRSALSAFNFYRAWGKSVYSEQPGHSSSATAGLPTIGLPTWHFCGGLGLFCIDGHSTSWCSAKMTTRQSPQKRTGRSTVLSLPNILTYGRILAVPAVVATAFVTGDFGRWLSLGIFIAASITDFFDGYLARAWHQQSALGRMLDPIADKLLISACLIVLTANQVISGLSLWPAAIILMREISVSGLREFLAELRVSVPVTNLAKWKTTFQMVALGFLLAAPAGDKVLPYNTEIGIALLWVAALLTLYTGYDYFRAGIRHLIESDH